MTSSCTYCSSDSGFPVFCSTIGAIVGIVDADEINSFIKAVKTLNNSVLNSRKNNYTEVTFRARSGFEAGCIFTDGSWSGYMMLEAGDGTSVVFVKPNDFVTLGTFLADAKSKMKN